MFSNEEVLQRLDELDVILIKADKTKPSPEIDADLARFGRFGLPNNLIYPADPDAPPIIMPERITAEIALEALEQAVAMSQ